MLAGAPDAFGFAAGVAAGFEPVVAPATVVRVVRRAAAARRVDAGLAVFAPDALGAAVTPGAAEAPVDAAADDRDVVVFRAAGLAAVVLAAGAAEVRFRAAAAAGFAAGFGAGVPRVVAVAAEAGAAEVRFRGAAAAGFAAVAGAGFFATGFLAGFDAAFARAGGDDAGGETDVRTGVTAWLAWAAADPTLRAAPDVAPVTVSAADPAAEDASAATRDARDATSLSAAAACRRRLVTCLRPFVPRATASWRRRFASVFRAAASRFSSLCSSLAAPFDSGLTAPVASTMTSATVSITTPVRLLLAPAPSSPLAIDRPSVQRPTSKPRRSTASGGFPTPPPQAASLP